MNLSVGIVGLPNVGKSTLFNALLKKQHALAANYPFATIEPNVGIVPVPDPRLQVLADIVRKDMKILGYKDIKKENDESLNISVSQYPNIPPLKPAMVNFVDIAGLVKGASEGAGLGNKFLSHIREVSIIVHVVRAFADENVIREGSVDPKSDYETTETELILADLQTLENVKGKAKSAKQQLTAKSEAIEKLTQNLNSGKPARDVQFSDEEREAVKDLFLLTMKPEIIVLNVSETDYSREKIDKTLVSLSSLRDTKNENMVVISAQIESELASLSENEQREYLKDLGLEHSGLERLIQKAYETLGLISFLTAGEKEVRAWTLPAGTPAVRASGVIHTDFEKKFIKAEVVSFEDFVQNNGWKNSRTNGKARLEGKDYIMKDGDVVEFKIGT